MNDLLSTIEVAQVLRVTPDRVIQLANAGRIPLLGRFGPRGIRIYSRLDAERLAAQRRNKVA